MDLALQHGLHHDASLPDYFPNVMLSINLAGRPSPPQDRDGADPPRTRSELIGSRLPRIPVSPAAPFDRRPGHLDKVAASRSPASKSAFAGRARDSTGPRPGRRPSDRRCASSSPAVLVPHDRRPDDLDAKSRSGSSRGSPPVLVILLSKTATWASPRGTASPPPSRPRGSPGAHRAAQPLRNACHLDERLVPSGYISSRREVHASTPAASSAARSPLRPRYFSKSSPGRTASG